MLWMHTQAEGQRGAVVEFGRQTIRTTVRIVRCGKYQQRKRMALQMRLRKHSGCEGIVSEI